MKTILGMFGRIPRPTPAMSVALLALLIACSGAAVAAIPSADGTITACRDNKTGALRIINAEGGQTCNSKETQLAWKDGIHGKVADSLHADNATNAANADTVDGKHASDFYVAGSKVADAAHADQADSATRAGDANTLDGKDSTEFLGKTEKAVDADTLDGLDSTQLGAGTSAARVGRLTLPVPPPGGQPNSGTVLETAAFEIQGHCINGIPSLNAPAARLLLVAKQVGLASTITYSPERSTTPTEILLRSGESIDFAETHVTSSSPDERITYGSYFADAVTSSDSLHGHGTLSILSSLSGPGESCRFSATGLGQ